MRKWLLAVVVSLLVVGAVSSVQAVGCEAHEGTALTDGCLYTITGGDTVDTTDGFSVRDTDTINWYTCVQTLNLQDVGYPIAQPFEFQGFQVLALQKVMLQYRPDYAHTGPCSQFAYLNTMDLLANTFEVNLGGVPAHAVLPEDTGASWAQIEANHLALLDQNPVIKAKFLEKSNWIHLYGLPIAYENQPINGNPNGAQVLRAQRAVWRIFNVEAPGTAVGVPHLLNVPDMIKQLDGLIIPTIAKSPITQAQAEGLAPPPMVIAKSLVGYGMQGEFRRSNDQALADLVTGAGFGWVKQQVPWEEVEKFWDGCEERVPQAVQGGWDWEALDRFVNTMTANNLKILLSVVKAPACYKAADAPVGHGPPTDPTKFQRFMRELARRYKGRVHAYELWNESNLQREWGTLGPNAAGEFAELVKNGYIGAKEGDPNAYVGLGAPTPAGDNPPYAIDDRGYLQLLWSVNNGEIANYFEFLGVHPNGGPNAPDDTVANPSASNADCGGGWSTHDSFFFNRYEQLYADMIAAGPAFKDKVIWITEFGWASIDNNPAEGYGYAKCNTEQEQADYMVRAYQKVAQEALYVTHMFIWNLNFQEVVPKSDEKWAFGIVDNSLNPRPAYTAVKNMSKGGGVPAG